MPTEQFKKQFQLNEETIARWAGYREENPETKEQAEPEYCKICGWPVDDYDHTECLKDISKESKNGT